MSSPFSPTQSKPGNGTIHLALLDPKTPRLRTVNYQYPLKLVSPAPLRTDDRLVHTVYLLTYGGGLVAGDAIDLHVVIEKTTRLVLLTQGSTKLFKSPNRDVISKQCMTVDIAPGSALCYLPDPVQPFEKSCFEQKQVYNIAIDSSEPSATGSLCVLDWVSNGRPANGENWSLFHYGSKNEIFLCQPSGGQKLLLRDAVLLDDAGSENSVASRMDGMAVFGTLVLYGPLFKRLGQFFADEFRALPRIGGRKWDSSSESGDEDVDPAVTRRLERQRQEKEDGLLWSAASVRGCVVVKFGTRELEHGRRFLRSMLVEEGTVEAKLGERALLCLR
jgi:urease accessory protein